MLEVEDWTQPTSQKRHTVSRRITSPPPPPSNEPKLASSAPDLPSGPPEAEVEETFRVTRPPTSHLFPVVRNRSSSSPSARPSSLSRLLAQASADAGTSGKSPTQSNTPPLTPATKAPEPTPLSPTEVPATSPSKSMPIPASSPPPITTAVPIASAPSTATVQPSPVVPNKLTLDAAMMQPYPVRPGSRASRVSTTSRYSAGLIPSVGGSASTGHVSIPKAIATTALTDQTILSTSPTSQGISTSTSETPSPRGSVTDGLAGIFGSSRRRLTSTHSPLGKTSLLSPALDTTAEAAPHARTGSTSSALANLASWSVSLGRRRKSANLDPPAEEGSGS
jgi:autophagy-related protein 11